MAKHFILMADIINSRLKDPSLLIEGFKEVTTEVKCRHPEAFLSPITITLGDEFQSITRSVADGVRVIYDLEESIVQKEKNFKLRYVLNQGDIETPVNSKTAYGMLGEGLTETRVMLDHQKKNKYRFLFHLIDVEKTGQLNLCFQLYQLFVDRWKTRDLKLVADFLRYHDYKEVARWNGKDASLMWKRKKSLKIDEYEIIKKIIIGMVN